jgi:hypothetical protein
MLNHRPEVSAEHSINMHNLDLVNIDNLLNSLLFPNQHSKSPSCPNVGGTLEGTEKEKDKIEGKEENTECREREEEKGNRMKIRKRKKEDGIEKAVALQSEVHDSPRKHPEMGFCADGDEHSGYELIYIVTYWVCHATNKFTLSGCSEALMSYHSYTVQLHRLAR